MILNQLTLILCLVLLFVTKSSMFRALRNGDPQLARVFQLLWLGLSLSACSYLMRLMLPASDLARLVGFLCIFSGSVLIWVGGLEHAHLRRLRLRERPVSPDEVADDGPPFETVFPTTAGLPPLDSCARRVLRHALDEARRCRQCRVDTDHMLLGLLQERHSASADILERLNIGPENIRLALGQASVSDAPAVITETLPLTDRTLQALSLAAQEAHRFEKTVVGTDHLLLGLVLMGKGAAAISLFQEGATVDGIRDEILRSRTS